MNASLVFSAQPELGWVEELVEEIFGINPGD